MRSLFLVLVVSFAFGLPVRAGDEENWLEVEVVKFVDFDDVRVVLEGKKTRVFLAGLRPIREVIEDEPRRERVRAAVEAKLKKNELFARILTKSDAAVLGVSVDAFAHRRNDFGHPWNPNEYPYCWSGFGAYNLNTYFLFTRRSTFDDNLGDGRINENYRASFRKAVKKISAER